MTSIRSLATRWAGTAWLPAFAVAVVAAAVPRHALAQDNYSSRPIRVAIGFAAGGGTDLTLRMIASKLTDILSVPVIVENRPGANANVAARAVVTPLRMATRRSSTLRRSC